MITNIGGHKVKCGNLIDGIDDLMGNDMADILYSDPPWGEGNLKYWNTINQRDNKNEQKENVSLDKFLNILFSVAVKYCRGPIIIEYGIRWKASLIDKAKEYKLNSIIVCDAIYKTGSKFLPLNIHVFSNKDIMLPEDYKDTLKNTSSLQTVRMAIKPFAQAGKIILDPCCGMGKTAAIAKEYDMIFRGNELNKKRLDKTIKLLK